MAAIPRKKLDMIIDLWELRDENEIKFIPMTEGSIRKVKINNPNIPQIKLRFPYMFCLDFILTERLLLFKKFFFLWCNPISVSREHADFSDVCHFE